MTTRAEIGAGASIAARFPTPSRPLTVTRADIVGPFARQSLKSIESPGGKIDVVKFPQDIGPHFMNIGISESNRRTSSNSLVAPRTNDIKNTESNIILPLPENIKDMTRVNYSESPVVGGANALGAGGALLGSLAGAALRAAGPAAAAFAAGASAIGEASYNDIIAQSGVTPNQMLTVLLQGPTYKTHSFTWKLYPKTKAESDLIKRIIYDLKIASRPGSDANRQYFTFPRLFNLSFCINGKYLTEENDPYNYLFAFKPAVLEGISVNYTPSGQPALYKGVGAPDGVELTLNFKEVEYWLGEDTEGLGKRLSEVGAFGVTVGDVGEAAGAVGDGLAALPLSALTALPKAVGAIINLFGG
jgi:hypothetical protein